MADINEDIKDLIEVFEDNNALGKKNNKIIKDLTRKLDALTKNVTKAENSIFGHRTNPLSKRGIEYMLESKTNVFFARGLSRVFNDKDLNKQLTKRALAFGSNLNDVIGKDREGLIKGIAGFNQQLEAQVSLQEGGFIDVTQGMRDLTSRMDATGQDSKKMIAVFKQANVLAGLSNDETANLFKATEDASKIYGTKADVMVGAIEALSERMLDLASMNLGKEITDAVGIEALKLGQGTEKDLARLVNSVLEGGEGYMNLIKLGLNEEVNTLINSQGKSTEQVVQALEAIIKNGSAQAGMFAKQFNSGQANMPLTNKAFRDVFGPEGQILIALGKLNPKEAGFGKNRSLTEDFDIATNEVFSRFDATIQKMQSDTGHLIAMDENLEAIKIATAAGAGLSLLDMGIRGGKAFLGSNLASKIGSKLFSKGAAASIVPGFEMLEAAGAGTGGAAAGAGGMGALGVLGALGIAAGTVGAVALAWKLMNMSSNKKELGLVGDEIFNKHMSTYGGSQINSTNSLTSVGDVARNYSGSDAALYQLVSHTKKGNDLQEQVIKQLKSQGSLISNQTPNVMGK